MEWISFHSVENTDAELHASPESSGLSDEAMGEIQQLADLEFHQIILWVDGPPGVAYPIDNPDQHRDISTSKQGYYNQIRQFVDAAHQRSLKAHLYTTWAIAVKRTDQMDGRPFIFETSIATDHPDKSTIARDDQSSMRMAKDPQSCFYPVAMAGLGYPQICSALVDYYTELIEKTGADGFQIEPLGMPIDADGVSIYGYEEPIVASFQEVYGRDAHAILNADKQWVDFRCGFTIVLIEKIRRQLNRLDRKVTFSAVGYSLSDDRRHLFPWKTIVQRRLVDEFYFRVSPIQPQQQLKEIDQAKIICEKTDVPFVPSFDLKCGDDKALTKQKIETVEVCLKSLIEAGTKRIALYGTPTIISAWPNILKTLKTQN